MIRFRLGEGTQFEDSVSFRIARETKYSKSSRKCCLKLLPIR